MLGVGVGTVSSKTTSLDSTLERVQWLLELTEAVSLQKLAYPGTKSYYVIE